MGPSSTPSSQPSGQPSGSPSGQPSLAPSGQPSSSPTVNPTGQPSDSPTSLPTTQPTGRPSAQPSSQPSLQPSSQPTTVPSSQPSAQPSDLPTAQPSSQPSGKPSIAPSSTPSSQPSGQPSGSPSGQPSMAPSGQPTSRPSVQPSGAPSSQPSGQPSMGPSSTPSSQPSGQPSGSPSGQPSLAPSGQPTSRPSVQPSGRPSAQPSGQPSMGPSSTPSSQPSGQPSGSPSGQPSLAPSGQPTSRPSVQPSGRPSAQPSGQPSMGPSSTPSSQPSGQPSGSPSGQPSLAPSGQPTSRPSVQPSGRPSAQPSGQPSMGPSSTPSSQPSGQPSGSPSGQPSLAPSGQPSSSPTVNPTGQPSDSPTSLPTTQPTGRPSAQPSSQPSLQPSSQPTTVPSSQPSAQPSDLPTAQPSSQPSGKPSIAPSSTPSSQPSGQPSGSPSGQPSMAPSGQPTSRPSVQPSGAPSSQPSGQPSMGPSSTPSSQPSGQPSGSPSGQPSMAPSGQPSTSPTVNPTGQPSDSPTSSPTTQPTGRPSAQPSSQPSLQPSSQPTTPTAFPTAQPSSQPTSFPSSQPTESPSAQPTSQPSGCPSGQPTSQPSFEPSSQPTSSPTSQPSSQPSSVPSSQPSSQPTASPSSQPSAKPSSQPTGLPSSQPSGQPSSQPSQPTSGPSKYPTTSSPTRDGETNRPTRYPTSAPSFNLNGYLTERVYKDFLSNQSYFSVLSSSLTFSSFFYKGVTVSGSCEDWFTFYDQQFLLPYDDAVFYAISAWYEIYDFGSRTYRSILTTCADTTAVKTIVNGVRLGSESEYNCDGNTWRVFNCQGRRVFCINCKKICVPTEACPGRSFITNPCQSCSNHAAMGGVVNFKYRRASLYPKFNSIKLLQTSNTSLVLGLNVTNPGLLYCAAFLSWQNVTSVVDIYNGANQPLLINSSSLFTTMTINNLSPSTLYRVYCYSESWVKDVMPFTESSNNSLAATTSCCKYVLFSSSTPSVMYHKTIQSTSKVFFGLSSRPSGLTNVRVLISSSSSCNGTSSKSSSATATPSLFSFKANTDDLSRSFIVSGSAGCYLFQLLAFGGDSYINASTVIGIYNASNSVLPAPTIISARLDDDGNGIKIMFGSPTNTPNQNGTGTFSCTLILLFNGVDSSSCRWTNTTTLQLSLGSLPSISPGDSITILAGKIAAACYSSSLCNSYPTLSSSNMTLLLPLNPLKPSLSLTAQQMLLYCDDLYLDATSSIGNGGRSWNSIKWSVGGSLSKANLTVLTAYMNANYQDITSVMIIPNNQLFLSRFPDNLTFSLEVTNYLGATSAVSVTVFFQYSTLLTPRLFIAGPSKVFLQRSSALSLFANATLPACLSSSSVQNFRYTWSVFKGSSLLSITSTSIDQRYFKLPAYSLDVGTSYVIQVRILLNAMTSKATMTSSSVSVTVGSSGVLSKIAGGASQVVNAVGSFALDGSQSLDLDSPSDSASMQFTWSCTMLSPTYGSTCADGSFPLNGIKVNAPLALMATGSYLITLTVQNSFRSDSSSLVLNITSDDTFPTVQINTTSLQKTYSGQSKIIIVGTVTTESEKATALWESSLSPLSSYSTSASLNATISASTTQSLQLVIPPNILSADTSYSFALSASYLSSLKTAMASIDLAINSPPQGGVLAVTPSQGVALTTLFTMTSSFWTDDADDLPLRTLFGYYLLDQRSSVVLKGLDEVSAIYVPLGQGLKSRSYVITCFANVSDIYGATATAENNATVTPVQPTSTTTATSLIISALQSFQSTATITGNSDLAVQAMSSTAIAVNSVDCTTSKTCSSINRQACTTTAKTCGPCLDGYVGIAGDSNIPCQIASVSKAVGANCSSNATCYTGFCKSGKCVDVSKSCPANCNSRGSCIFTSYVGETLSFCSVNDPTCTASCQCVSGRYGRDCSVLASQYSQLRSLRESLCSGLYTTALSQDTSYATYHMRAKLAGDILLDSSMLTDNALWNCSKVLVESVQNNPTLSCQDDLPQLITSGLSYALSVYQLKNASVLSKSLYQSLLIDIQETMAQLVSGCQSLQGSGEASRDIITSFIRHASVRYPLASSSLELSLPRTTSEKSNGYSTAKLKVEAIKGSNAENLGISLIQYLFKPSSIETDSMIVETVFSYEDLVATSGSTRRLASSSVPSVNMTIVIPNAQEIVYNSTENYNISVTCSRFESEVYYLTAECHDGEKVNVTCPVDRKGVFNITCPARRYRPACSISTSYGGNLTFSRNANCELKSFSEWNSTCYCSFVDGVQRRRLDGSSDNVNSLFFATVTTLEVDPVSTSFDAWPEKLSVVHNQTIVITTAVVMGVFILGLFLVIQYDRYEQNSPKKFALKYKDKYIPGVLGSPIKKTDAVRTIQTFFENILPADFHPLPWKTLFYRRLLLEHSYLTIWSPSPSLSSLDRSQPSPLKSEKWLLSMCKFLHILCLSTILASLMFADNGQCDDHHAKQSCHDAHAVIPQIRACSWREDNQTCIFHRPTITFPLVMFYILIVTVLSAPLNGLAEVTIHRLSKFIQYAYHHSKNKVIPVAEDEILNEHGRLKEYWQQRDELHDIQEMSVKILRSARLRRMQQEIDFVLPSMESEVLLQSQAVQADRYGRWEIAIHHHPEYHQLQSPSTSQTSHHVRYLLTVSKTRQLSHSLDQVRQQSDFIKSRLERISDSKEREIMLMRYFLVHLFQGYRRNLVARHVLGSIQLMTKSSWYRFWVMTTAFLLPIVIAGLIAIIAILNLDIGSRASTIWLLLVFMAFIEDVIVLQPFKIALKWLIIRQSVSQDVYQLCSALRQRFGDIINRRIGNMHDLHALVQHLNPACRVARLFPHLPVSRLLIAVNDYDVPFFDLKRARVVPTSRTMLGFLFGFPLAVVFWTFDAFCSLPASLQDIVVEIVAALLINLFAIGFYFFGVAVPVAAIVVAVVLVLLLLLLDRGILQMLWQRGQQSRKMRSKPSRFKRYEIDLNTSSKDDDAQEVAGGVRRFYRTAVRSLGREEALRAAMDSSPAASRKEFLPRPYEERKHTDEELLPHKRQQQISSQMQQAIVVEDKKASIPALPTLSQSPVLHLDKLPRTSLPPPTSPSRKILEENELAEARKRAAKKTQKRLKHLSQDSPSAAKHKSILPEGSLLSVGSTPRSGAEKEKEAAGGVKVEPLALSSIASPLPPTAAAAGEAAPPPPTSARRRRSEQRQRIQSASSQGPGLDAQASLVDEEEEKHLRRLARRQRRLDRSLRDTSGDAVDYQTGIQHELARFDPSVVPARGGHEGLAANSSSNRGRRVVNEGPGSRRFDYASSQSPSPLRGTNNIRSSSAASPFRPGASQQSTNSQPYNSIGEMGSTWRNQFPDWH
eukprot:gene2291-2510_t